MIDLNEIDLKLIKVALERSVNYVTDKGYLKDLIEHIEIEIDAFEKERDAEQWEKEQLTVLGEESVDFASAWERNTRK